MRIVIDARMLYWTGIGRYTRALLDELERLDTKNDYVVLMRQADWALWEPTASNFSRVEANFDPYTVAEQWDLYRLLKRLRADVVHFTAPNSPLLYRGRRVVTIHDLTLLDFDTSRAQGGPRRGLGVLKRWAFRLVFWNDARFATRLVTDTEYVARQLAERYGVAKARVRAIWLAADPQVAEPESLKRFGELGRFVFYIGNLYPYKNLGSTLQALAELKTSHPELRLVVAGQPDDFTAALELRARQLGVSDRVKLVGRVTDGEMVALYRAAAAYVNPSLSEGFGLQGLEAMAQGAPVVAARATCLPEVYGEAAEYFDPRDAGDQARAVAQVLDDEAAAERLRRDGREWLKQFSWRRMAEQTQAVYLEAAESGD